MIQQQELSKIIQNEIPELREELRDSGTNTYRLIKLLKEHTVTAAMRQNYNSVHKCLALADKLYADGSKMVKSAVANVYVYAVDKMLHTTGEIKKWKGMIPQNLYSLYVRQMLQSGI